jgi:hypothetical protein
MRKLKHPLIISIIFFIAYFILILYYEVWRDEVEAWSLAFSSHSIKDLLYNTRYEGHPKLWFLLLYLLQRLTSNIFYMQLLHITIATIVVFIFFKYSPFSFIQKVLCCAGYFFFYEYAVISRNYAIEMALLFGSIALYTNKKEHALPLLSILLFLLLQTNVYAVIIAFGFYVYVVLDLMERKVSVKKILLITVVLIAGLTLSIISMKPPADGVAAVEGWNFHHSFGYVMNVIFTICKSYLPVPVFKNEFWNSNFLFYLDNPIITGFIISLCLVVLVIWFFRQEFKVMVFYLISTLGILTLIYSLYYGYNRHHGHLFIVLITSYWLYAGERNQKGNIYFLNSILIVQCIAAASALYYEIKLPFSNAEQTASYLKTNSLDKREIMAYESEAASAIAGLLNKNFYYPQYDQYGTYVIWNDASRKRKVTVEEAVKIMEECAQKDSSIVIFNDPLTEPPKNWTYLAVLNGSIVMDEDYYIYEIHKRQDH